MSKGAQESTSKEGSAVAKPRPMNLVSRNLLSAKNVKTTPQMIRFRDAKVCNNLATDGLTITEYSLTTGTKSELQNPEGKKSVLGIASAW